MQYKNDYYKEQSTRTVLRVGVSDFSNYCKELPKIFDSLYLKQEAYNGGDKFGIAVFNSAHQKIGNIPMQSRLILDERFVNSFKNNLPIAVSVVGIACVPLEVTIELVFHKSAGSIKKQYKRPIYFTRKKRISNQLCLF